jgi:hypothetical protein
LADGLASRSAGALVANLKAAGELLRSVADAGDRMQVSRRILDVAHNLDQARVASVEARPAAVSDADVVPIESLLDTVESLAPDAEIAPVDGGGLEASFRSLERLQHERGAPPASLQGLLGRVEPAADTVAIEALCYRGRPALERAAAIRQTLAAELAGVADLAAIRPLLQELLDLVPLALDES